MVGFFKSIRGYFDQSFGGRYLAIILCELAVHEPEAFARILRLADEKTSSRQNLASHFIKRRKDFSVTREAPFDGRASRRYADLAIRDGSSLRLLLEIKDDDINSPRNGDQLRDYLQYARKHKLAFVHLSKHFLDEDGDRELQAATQHGVWATSIRFRDLYVCLRKSDTPIARMLCDYLEESAMAYKRLDLESKTLRLSFVSMLGFPHRHGWGKLTGKLAVSDIGLVMADIFGDLEFIGDSIRGRNRKAIKTAFSRGWRAYPRYKLSDLKRLLKESDSMKSAAISPADEGIEATGGDVYFWILANVLPKTSNRSTDYLNMECGLRFDCTANSKANLLKAYVYARIYGKSTRANVGYCQRLIKARYLDEKKVLEAVGECLKKAKNEVLAESPRRYRTVLERLNLYA